MAERQESGKEGISDKRETHLAVLSLFGSALIWGLIWYPYRLLRDAGIHGIVSSSVTCAIAFALGLLFFRRSFSRFTPSWALLLLALSSGVCNLGYVLATLTGDVLRVLLLFYLAPLWTVLFAWILLGERLSRFGAYIIALSLAGALIMLWHPHIGLPVPRDSADWLGLGAGVCAGADTLSLLCLGDAGGDWSCSGGSQSYCPVWPGKGSFQSGHRHHACGGRLCRAGLVVACQRGAGVTRLDWRRDDSRGQPAFGEVQKLGELFVHAFACLTGTARELD